MLDNLNIDKIKGLSESEALERLKNEGYNELQRTTKGGFLQKIIEVVTEPVFLLLIACGAVYFLIGDTEEALMLMGFVLVVMGITIYQGTKTDKALEALRDLSSPRALVIRDGEKKRIAGREVAREDIIILAEGDRVPADAEVISCTNLMVDESLLTGESAPVRKSEAEKSMNLEMKPGGDDMPFVFSGTLVVGGTGIARVLRTGQNTEMGKIGKSLQELETEKTELQKEVSSIVKYAALGGILFCAFVVIAYGITRGNWLMGFLTGLTLAMSILPEEFPVVLTIFIAIGAWRMSKQNVLTRRQHAIHALGYASTLCVDKTGTLTMNSMTVKKLCSNSEFFDASSALPENFHELVEFGILASQNEPFDPMEKALKDISKALDGTEHLHSNWKLVKEYPISKYILAVSHAWKSDERESYIIAAKGAPEAIADLCHLGIDKAKEAEDCAIRMANEGLRVIGVAKSEQSSTLPEAQHDFKFEFLGLIGFADPVRPGVKESVAECMEAGIKVIMITGDYPGTAINIAKEIGLPYDKLITGSDLDSMNDEELARRISEISIFARAVPEQKLRIVNVLKKNGEIVAMTGDGVNDAPALKASHIGIAMGARGTDVAREASSVVIIDDDFSSIVKGVEMGRRIFDNIRKAMSYTLSIHIPIAGITMLSVLLGWPLILLPVHIVFLELIIDPACSVVFEAEPAESNIMKRKPGHFSEKIFNRKTIMMSALLGFAALAMVAAVFVEATTLGYSESQARAMFFVTLISTNLGLILSNISLSRNVLSTLASKNKALWMVSAGAIIFLAAALFIPFLSSAFMFGSLGPVEIIMSLTAGIMCLVLFELIKLVWSREA